MPENVIREEGESSDPYVALADVHMQKAVEAIEAMPGVERANAVMLVMVIPEADDGALAGGLCSHVAAPENESADEIIGLMLIEALQAIGPDAGFGVILANGVPPTGGIEL